MITTADLKATFQLPILAVKKNPQSPLSTQVGVMTKGTVIEVNVSELGMVTTGGKVVWASELLVDLSWLSLLSLERAKGRGNKLRMGRLCVVTIPCI